MADKRLIDANALLKEFEKRQEQQTNEYCDCFLNDAQELSTEWWCVEDAVAAAPHHRRCGGGAVQGMQKFAEAHDKRGPSVLSRLEEKSSDGRVLLSWCEEGCEGHKCPYQGRR